MIDIGSLMSGFADVNNSVTGTTLGIVNTIMQGRQNAQNQQNWENTFNYQKQLNNILMNREDTAVQRRAADLAAAGINPMIAGLGGASATPGGIINPLQQQAVQIPEGTGKIDASNTINAINELKKRQTEEKLAADSTEAQLELQRREIMNSRISDKAKYAHEKMIELMKDLNNLELQRRQAKDTAEQNKLDRDLQWKVATHKALRELFKDSEIPGLSTIWDNFSDNIYDENGNFSFKKFENEWENFKKFRDENLKKSLGFKKRPDGAWENDKGELWGHEIKTDNGGGRNF